MSRRPPRLSEWLFSSLLPPEVRDDVLGDLEERFTARSGVSESDARWWYRRQVLGGVARLLLDRLTNRAAHPRSDTVRHPSRGGFLSMREVSHAVRVPIREPALSATVVLVLALGVGTTTTMFSILHGMFRPLPLDAHEEIVRVARHDPERGLTYLPWTADRFAQLRAGQSSLVDLAAVDDHGFQLSGGDGRPERVPGAQISPWAFPLLRVSAALGRTLVESDGAPDAPAVVVLSDALWRRRFGGAPDVVGREVRLNGQVHTVVGVVRGRFAFPVGAELWIPLRTAVDDGPHALTLFGRLRPSVTVEQATLDLARLGEDSGDEEADARGRRSLVVEPLLARWVSAEDRTVSFMMMLVASFVLVIAAANVTNLLLARAVVRRKEVAVRMALGGSRARVLSLALLESLTLSVVGGVIGLIAARGGVSAFANAIAADIGRLWWMDLRVDAPAVLYACGAVIAASVVAGGLPAIQGSGIDVQSALRSESGGSTGGHRARASRALVGGQVALSCALLILCGLMIAGAKRLDGVRYAFDADRIVVGHVVLEPFDYPEAHERQAFQRALEDRLRAIPGAAGVSFSSNAPGLQGAARYLAEGTVYPAGRAHPIAEMRYVTEGFFEMFGLDPIEGRLFGATDVASDAGVAVVNARFAAGLDGDGPTVGRRFRLAGADREDEWITIVGVVADAGVSVREGRSVAGFFLPMARSRSGNLFFAVQSEKPGVALAELSTRVASVDPELPVQDLATLRETLRAANGPERTLAGLFGTFGALALVLAVVGLNGVVMFGASQRRREFGVRRALGATAGDIRWGTVRSGLRPLAVGLGLGVAAAWELSPKMASVLFGMDPHEPTLFLLVPAILAATAGVGLWLPAHRAGRSDPMVVLRGE